jgi:hypothetical protein
MIMRLMTKSLIAVVAILATSAAANAQSVRLRGTIETVSGEGFTMRTREGEQANVRLKAPYQIGALVKAQLSDIKPGAFIGTAAAPGPDGTLKAMEVHIFAEALRGMDEGFRRHCHGAAGLRSSWWLGSQGDEENQLLRIPVPA